MYRSSSSVVVVTAVVTTTAATADKRDASSLVEARANINQRGLQPLIIWPGEPMGSALLARTASPGLLSTVTLPSPLALHPALCSRTLLLLHRRCRYSFAPCAHSSLLRPLSLRPSSSVVKELRPPACYSRLSFLLRPLISLCVYVLVLYCLSPSVFLPSGPSRTTHAFSFSSSLFSLPAFPSFAYILPLLPVTVHHRILVRSRWLSFFLPYGAASVHGKR